MTNPLIVDTTLRDGEQAPGVAFTLNEKVEIAKALDSLGVSAIEAGVPAMGGDELEAVKVIASLGLKAEIIAWNRGSVKDIKFSLSCGIDRIHIALPVSDIQITHKLKKDRKWVLNQLRETVSFAHSRGAMVSVGAEDASRSSREFMAQFVSEAERLGVDRLRYCDTVGILDPFSTYQKIKELKSWTKMVIEIHTHNDFGLATANALAAIRAGAKYADTTVLGIGERAGNAALEEVAMALKHLWKRSSSLQTEKLASVAAMVSKAAKRPIPQDKPIVGEGVFFHESGIHADGVLKNPSTYEPFKPEEVGRKRQVVIGKHSGRASVLHKLADHGIRMEEKKAARVLEKVRKLSIHKKGSLTDEELLQIYRGESITDPLSPRGRGLGRG